MTVVLVQGHLLLPSDVTSDNIIGDDPPGINPDPHAATAYPVPTSHAFAVNMTVVTKNTNVGKRAWDLEVEGPNTTTYVATTAAKMEAICCNATVKLSSGPKPEVGHTVKGIAFNTSYEIVAETQNALPRRTYLDSERCATFIYNDLNQPVPLPEGVTVAQTEAATEATQPISIQNGHIYGVDGMPLTIKGVNWFGFETAVTVVHGLWQGPTALTQDFQNVALRMQLLGFNTIRLPFSFQVLLNLQPRSFAAACQPTSLQAIKWSVIPPGVTIADNIMPPDLPARDPQRDGYCNEVLPNTNVYARFIYFIRYLAANGFNIIIDNHFNVDTLAMDNPTQWVKAWAQLLTDIVADPASQQRVMVDILNEPDSRGLKWQGTTPDMTTLYLAAMDAMYKVSPTTLFLIEGCGQLGSAMNWGDGYITDASAIRIAAISDPNPFFTTLVSRPYLNNVVIAPHYYPPSVSTSAPIQGPELWQKMTQSFGYLTMAGYGGHIFPVIIGETGSLMTSAADLAFMRDMAAYMQVDNEANDGMHAPIPHMVWWDWNPNSGDTGGLVNDGWSAVIWNKIDYLVNAIDLQPWYMTVAHTGTERPSPTLPPTVSGTPFQPLNPAPAAAPPSGPPTAKPSNPPPPAAAPSVSFTAKPTNPPSTTPQPSKPPASQPGCDVVVSLGYPWNEGAKRMNTIQLALSGKGADLLLVPYTVEIRHKGYVSSNKAWNWGAPSGVTVLNGVASGQSWTTLPGTIGANIQSSDEVWFPDSVSINGAKCNIINANPAPAKPLSPPPPPPTPRPASPPPPPPPTCNAVVTLGYPWSEGAKRMNTVSLALSNRGLSAITVPWMLAVQHKGYVSTNKAWNWGAPSGLQVSNGVVSGPVTQAWAILQQNSANTIKLGANVQSTNEQWFPESVTVNGAKCNIIRG
ncbi:probable endoglucanase E1 [Coccomyxa sp. Obi]|nr:probable endoglucanase E1 [Coccomyxa sp. Obi]